MVHGHLGIGRIHGCVVSRLALHAQDAFAFSAVTEKVSYSSSRGHALHDKSLFARENPSTTLEACANAGTTYCHYQLQKRAMSANPG